MTDVDAGGVAVEIAFETTDPTDEEGGWRTHPEALVLAGPAVAAAAAALDIHPSRIEISLLLTDDARMRALNHQFRDRDSATNVLSWPAHVLQDPLTPAEFDALHRDEAVEGRLFMGDLAFGLETIAREAADQRKTLEDHFAHLIVHGVLHLFGYGHDEDVDAEVMEQRERVALSALGTSDPYSDRSSTTPADG